MKKFLLFSFLFFTISYVINAQVVLNEIYSDPGGTNHEYFEFYNNSTGAANQNLDCFTLVVAYGETGPGSSTSNPRGFFVIDIPAIFIAPQGFIVGSSRKSFSYQGNVGTFADFSWNDLNNPDSSYNATGYLKQWQVGTANLSDGNANYDDVTPVTYGGTGTPIDNLFRKVFSKSAYYIFVYQNGSLVNAFMGGSGGATTAALADIQDQPDLFIDMKGTCPDFTIQFSALTLSNFEIVQESDGTDNGYFRKFDGACGTWNKASSPGQHNPNASNGNPGDAASVLTTAQVYICGDLVSKSSVRFSVTGGDANLFPVETQLYYDNTIVGTFGPSDVYQSSVNVPSPSPTVYSFTNIDYNQPVILVYKAFAGCFGKVVALDGSCAPLPVTMSIFNAERNYEFVNLSWETTIEQNSHGFEVQRRIGSGDFETIAFVESKATDGNSESVLIYEYNDYNTTRGISQYRIRQVDFDERHTYSDIRAVRGESQKGKTIIYPNPSSNGVVNVIFEETDVMRDVTLMDMSGRLISQWNNVSTNNIRIDNLTTGVYGLRIIDRDTGDQSFEKIIVR